MPETLWPTCLKVTSWPFYKGRGGQGQRNGSKEETGSRDEVVQLRVFLSSSAPCSEDLTLSHAFGDAAVTSGGQKVQGSAGFCEQPGVALVQSHGIPGQAQFPAFLARLSSVTGRLPAAPGPLPVLLATQQTERQLHAQQRAQTGVACTGGSHPGHVGRDGGGGVPGWWARAACTSAPHVCYPKK